MSWLERGASSTTPKRIWQDHLGRPMPSCYFLKEGFHQSDVLQEDDLNLDVTEAEADSSDDMED